MEVRFDRSMCAGWFQCVQEWDSFEMNMQDQKADLADADEADQGVFTRSVPDESHDEVVAAAESCPVNAIEVRNADGETLYPNT